MLGDNEGRHITNILIKTENIDVLWPLYPSWKSHHIDDTDHEFKMSPSPNC